MIHRFLAHEAPLALTYHLEDMVMLPRLDLAYAAETEAQYPSWRVDLPGSGGKLKDPRPGGKEPVTEHWDEPARCSICSSGTGALTKGTTA